jgi:catechol 2,3-dioxygenase-like lactoylglutathione lyase family enzyme
MRLLPLAALAVLSMGTAGAQPPPAAPSAATIGFMHAIHATEDLETTLAFYTDVFGLTAPVQPFMNPAVPVLTNSPGVSLRLAMLSLPGQGFNFELTEFSNVERRAAQASIVDPGAPRIKILVRDLAPVVAVLDERHAPIVTRSASPVEVTTALGTVQAILCRDPDGYLVEVVEVSDAETAGNTPSGNVVGAIMGITVADLDESLEFWNGLLGFDLEADPEFSNDAAMLDLLGIKGRIEFRTAQGVVPGSAARIELIEFRDVPSNPFDLRVPDPGASGIAIRVAQIDALFARLKAEGVRVISKDEVLVEWSPSVRNVFVKDPNGFNLELVGSVEGSPAR